MKSVPVLAKLFSLIVYHAQRTILYSLFLMTIFTNILHAQSGGPPMITDDPGTPEIGNWEINFSFNSDLKKYEKEFETPLMDINFGYNERTQLKVEFPYLFTKSVPGEYQGRFGDVTFGIKYRFLDENRFGIALSIYPQITVATETEARNEYLFPLQIEKSFGKVVLGIDVRYAYVNGDEDFIQNGILFGYGFSEGLEVMGEFVYWAKAQKFDDIEGVFNLGLKYQMNDVFTFMISLGKGLLSPDSNLRTTFISFVGFQINI